jgi:hypothetical protein
MKTLLAVVAALAVTIGTAQAGSLANADYFMQMSFGSDCYHFQGTSGGVFASEVRSGGTTKWAETLTSPAFATYAFAGASGFGIAYGGGGITLDVGPNSIIFAANEVDENGVTATGAGFDIGNVPNCGFAGSGSADASGAPGT